ncbi:helix-turn-helix domain-containing protein [Streptomyces acidicola]|uniref:helix-turn-helix domain-containing protein n=1 Tax=Streptomyces acidicola TaxID=2596892 RepID=UPI00341B6816
MKIAEIMRHVRQDPSVGVILIQEACKSKQTDLLAKRLGQEPGPGWIVHHRTGKYVGTNTLINCPTSGMACAGVQSRTSANRLAKGWVRRRSTAQALALRSRIVLECAQGHSIMEVSRRLKVAPDTVRTWRRRFLDRGLDGLSDEPRPGVPRKITDADVERVIVRTLEEKPANATHWSTRSMAAAQEHREFAGVQGQQT